MENNIVNMPYISRIESTMVNGKVVWYRNKLKNTLLKIRQFFNLLKCSDNTYKYNNTVNPKYYQEFKIN